ncbi:MAG: amidophosphoribosyltransferase [Prolixibacteraceae bacterium]|jgi:amidophosphoribosyltransferase|nr:amidophosphoribosyltransferase [Prolixibacteraceae bacterium]MDI9562726.1 amidophosphoribosyltransferase [Bacteroidota bacterium]NLS99671.1 amidophosphoribosyltransferase [Bacteroidales bacterium]OQB81726.1 MAG: Amidophosphoribosyltransferase precursor [Bacteroidetes bacterium ADurb.Bin123]HNZ67734.1 amidophosphoribosyltransferase [Prolixibacteraceae bacterium]
MSGFFGSIGKANCVYDVFYGTDYHSHLGTKRAGLAFYNAWLGFQRAIHSIENDYFRSKFAGDIKDFAANSGIGVISDMEAQPIVVNSHLGKFAIVTVSKINNLDELEARLLKKRNHFAETSQGGPNPTELTAMLICEADDLVSGIENVYRLVKGSCSMLLLTEKGLIAARDKLGRTPVMIGRKEDTYAVASESCSFFNLGFETVRDLGPGEIVRITADGVEILKRPYEKMQICAFLWVYYGYPPSFYEGINVEECRYRCGAALARRDNILADFVSGIPDSGIAHAVGYSNQSKIPYMRPYAKYTPTWPRSFMPLNQEIRNLVAKMKLIPNRSLVGGKSGIFCDDSIVRGTQLIGNTRDLYEAGIREIHMRVACPPLLYPCEFLNFSRSKKAMELATRKAIKNLEGDIDANLTEYGNPDSERYGAMTDAIKNSLNLTSLKFQRLGDLVDAIGLSKAKLCTHCWDHSSYS